MRKLLWIGDAVASTGFARCTHQTLETLRRKWNVHVLGVNYLGDPHNWPYPIYPCWPGGDGFGIKRVADLVERIQPDLVVIQNDPWNVPEYMKQIKDGIPVVASMPVDGKNCTLGLNLLKLKEAAKKNGSLAHTTELAGAIFWTHFGEGQALQGGYTGPSWVIPLGVDLGLYRPIDQVEARKRVVPEGVPEGAFLVGNINRNQPRKRLDLTIEYFAEWVHSRDIKDAYLSLFVAPTGEMGYNVRQLMRYYGFTKEDKKLILAEPHIGMGVEEELLPFVYSTFDVQLSTTQGEGWGLTTMEGMACGIPQIIPDWSALGEWARDAAWMVPCLDHAVTPTGINVVGGIPDKASTVQALDHLYNNREARTELRKRGFALVNRPEYRWPAIGEAFAAALEAVVG